MNYPKTLTTTQDLIPLLESLSSCSEIALDTEADSLFAYKAQVCLIQITADKRDWIIDPLGDVDLNPLLQILSQKSLLLHGCDYDLRMLAMEYGFKSTQVWDTMIAGRYLSEPHIGLGALVQKYFGVELDKSNQKANWAMRPIPADMLAYAAHDTHYLADLSFIQREALISRGKLDWVLQHCDMVRSSSTIVNPEEEDSERWRLKGSQILEPRAMAVLRELWKWREFLAESRNVPSFKVMIPDIVLKISERFTFDHTVNIPRIKGKLQNLPRNIHGVLFDQLVDAVARGIEVPLDECPRPLPRPVPPPSPNAQLMEKLKLIRDQLAHSTDTDPSLISNRHQMNHIGLNLDQGVDECLARAHMLPWQIELWTTELHKL